MGVDFDYVQELNENLKCPICCTAFIEPITISCGHTYCLQCFKFQICPLDRSKISLQWSQSRIISNMVDELIVYCTRKGAGCVWQGERSLLNSHLKHCLHVPNLSIETLRCEIDTESNTTKRFDGATAVTENPELTRPCLYCDNPYFYMDDHLERCPRKPVCCKFEKFGCRWAGQFGDLNNHLEQDCNLKPMENYLNIQHTQYQQLKDQNKLLQDRLLQQEQVTQTLQSQLNGMEPQGNVHPFMLDSITQDVRVLRSELFNLGTKLAEQDFLRNEQRNKEYQEIKGEFMMLRAGMQQIQIQLMNLSLPSAPSRSSSPKRTGATKL